MGRQRPDLPHREVLPREVLPQFRAVPQNRCYRTPDPIALAREIETALDTLWKLAVYWRTETTF